MNKRGATMERAFRRKWFDKELVHVMVRCLPCRVWHAHGERVATASLLLD